MKLASLTRSDDPGPLLAALRGEGPLVRLRVPLVGEVWTTTTDEAARAVLKDVDRFARDPRPVTGRSLASTYWWLPKRLSPLLESLLTKDGDDHRRLRRLVDRAFAKQAIDDLRPRLAARADALLRGMDPGAPADAVAGYTRPLPFEAIVDLLGLPERSLGPLRRGVAPLSSISGPVSAVLGLARLGGVQRLLRAEIEDARHEPRPGLLSDLVADMDGDRLSDDEALAMVFTLFVAGHETTVHLLNACLLTLCDAPALRDAVAEDAGARALFVEEVMRHFSPVALTKAHYARADADVMGVRVRKGEAVMPLLFAANHDPARFDRPGNLRADRRPNAHLGFGHGPHVCLGMQLARAEAQVGVERMLRMFPRYELASATRPGWTRRVGIRAPSGLSLRLRPRVAR
ncbi:cytochrome P450 [Jannaschia sp. Os4]|uniref:cytochrome P450 n=1 Tax=Jannaschia sp. Os4 TaxID=2807617 RepID=UPI001939556A|nr:cytochrome P450 [Jannaschia sp. Os4]MBM2576958.1 cytochrome P450 [Jannaschia sp. Os4]